MHDVGRQVQIYLCDVFQECTHIHNQKAEGVNFNPHKVLDSPNIVHTYLG